MNGYLWIILEVDDLVQRLIIEVIIVPVTRHRGQPQRLEHHAEEPGKEDVAGNQPGQLPPVFFAVTDPHSYQKIR